MLSNTDITNSDTWQEISRDFVRDFCIGCPYAEQERITEGIGAGCYLEQPTDVLKDTENGECSSRWFRDYVYKDKPLGKRGVANERKV